MSGKAEDSGVATIPSSEQAEWADVSSLLRNACKDLHDGELIHGENFSLFSAMSALEIMDPKMDSGMVSKYRSVDEAIENGVAPVPLGFDRTIDVQCIIDIMDHLLSCEATWHKGQSLAQTIYSCIYLLRPERTSSHALLHSYCRIIRATCKAVISVVSDTRTHEEEDLFTMSHGLPLNGDGDEKCLTMLNAVEETLSRQLRASKATSMKKRLLEDIEPLQTNSDLEEGYCKAILSRLRFRKHFYHVLTSMRRPQERGLGLARKHIASCFVELEGLRSSSGFLRSSAHRSCKAGENDRTTASGSHPIGFDPNLNSKFAAPTPPRSIRTLSWDKAIEYFEKLLHDLDVICSHSSDPLLEGVLQFVVQFQKSQPDLVARAHLQLLVVQDGKLYGKEPMFAVICKAAALPEDIMNHDIQKNEYIVHLGLLLINLLKILCTNVAWQRRKLGKILQDWCVIHIQIELSFRKEFGELLGNINDENLCVKLAKNILIWIEEQTYWIATRFLVLGFELELYTAGEYCMVYWYLHIVLIMLAEKIHLRTAAKNNTAKRKGKKKRDSTRDAAKDNQIPPAMLFLQCQIYIAEGLAMMLAALRNEQKVFQSPGPFNTENEKFAQHFEPLQKACIPDNISYLSFMEFTTYTRFSTLSVYNYFKEAQRIAKELRSSYSNDTDKLAELRRLEQVAEHNGVALNLICRVGTLDPSLKVSFEFGHHPHFATAVVKRSHGRSLS